MTMASKANKKKKRIWAIWVLTVLVIVVTVVLGSDRTTALRQGHASALVPLTKTPGQRTAEGTTPTSAVRPTGTKAPTGKITPTGAIAKEPTGTDSPIKEQTPTPVPTNTQAPTPTQELAPTQTMTPTQEIKPTEIITPTPADVRDPKAPTPTPVSDGTTFVGAGGRVIYKNRPMVAMTFDDGPLADYTSALMDLFERYNSRATFFTVGYKIDNYPHTVQDAYSRGFQIANHTLNHVFLDKTDLATAEKEVHENEEKLRALGIKGVIMLRPPYGEYTADVAAMVHTPMIGWSVDSRDWETKNAGMIREQIIADVRDGYIVLCHDIYESTVEAMQYVVPALIESGYQLVTVDELFFARGVTPENGVYYRYVKKTDME